MVQECEERTKTLNGLLYNSKDIGLNHFPCRILRIHHKATQRRNCVDNEKLMLRLTIIPLIIMGVAFMIGFIFDLGT